MRHAGRPVAVVLLVKARGTSAAASRRNRDAVDPRTPALGAGSRFGLHRDRFTDTLDTEWVAGSATADLLPRCSPPALARTRLTRSGHDGRRPTWSASHHDRLHDVLQPVRRRGVPRGFDVQGPGQRRAYDDNRRRSAAHQFTQCVAPLRSAGIATSTEATAKTVVPEK